jgi:hypothetical protein
MHLFIYNLFNDASVECGRINANFNYANLKYFGKKNINKVLLHTQSWK